jgi:crossover junction endodeoxyribonuclease RuvC
MRVLGLDPGSQKLGYGLLERRGDRWHRLDSGTFVLGSRLPLPVRLEAAFQAVSALLAAQPPDLVVVEDCFVAHSPKAALVLGQVRGVLLLAIEQAGISSCEYSAREVKLAAVGNGGAAKEQVQYMVPRLLEDCPALLEPDEADALAVAWCGAIHAQADSRLGTTGP